MAVGAATGAVAGKFADVGVNDDFMKQLGASWSRARAALIALGRTQAQDKLLERISPYGGEVIQTSLTEAGGAAARRARRERSA